MKVTEPEDNRIPSQEELDALVAEIPDRNGEFDDLPY